MTFLTIQIENPVSRLSSTYKTVANKHEVEVKELTREICMKYPFEHLGEYTKLFYDFDWDKEKKDKKGNILLPAYSENKELVKKLIDHLETIQDHYTNGFVFTNGSTPTKLSLHIVFKRQFIKRVKNVIPRKDIVEWLLGDLYKTHHAIVDHQVYDPNRKMRLPYGTFEDKTNPHIPNRFCVNELNEFLINPVISKIKIIQEEEKKEEEKEVKEEPKTDDSRKENMMKCLEMIKKERFCDRPTWLELGGLMRANKLNVKDFLRFSKDSGYANYNEEDCYKLWYTLSEDKGCGFPKLQQWAKEDGIDVKKLFPSSILNELLTSWLIQGEFTDSNIACTLFNHYQNYLIYTSQGWFHYDKKWKLGDKNSIFFPVMKLLSTDLLNYLESETVKSQKKLEITDEDKKNEKMRTRLRKDVNKLQSASKIKSVLDVAEGIFKNDDVLSTFDTKPHWFCFDNQKAFNLKTKEVIDIVATDRILTTCGYDLPERIEEDIEKVKKLISTVIPEKNFKSLLSSLSLFFYGQNINELFLIFKGEGRNGKGLISLLLMLALGNYYYSLPTEVLTEQSKGSGRAKPELAQTRWSRCVMSSEPDAQRQIVKTTLNLLTGRDPITVRQLQKEPFSFIPSFTLGMMCNDVPNVSGGINDAIKERIVFQNFPYTFVDEPTNPNHRKIDRDLKNKIKDDMSFRNGLFYLLTDTWYENKGKYISCDDSKDEADVYAKANNPIMSFLDEYEQSENFQRITDLQKEYENNFGVDKITPQKFKKFLEEANIKIEEDKKKGHKVFLRKKLII